MSYVSLLFEQLENQVGLGLWLAQRGTAVVAGWRHPGKLWPNVSYGSHSEPAPIFAAVCSLGVPPQDGQPCMGIQGTGPVGGLQLK